jgi:hypothetical protein
LRLEKNDEGFAVSLVAAQVNLVLLDFRLGLHILDVDDESLKIVIATRFSSRQDNGPTKTLDPKESDPALGALAVAVRHQTARTCRVTRDGTLRLGFDSGLMLEVGPDPDYEAWQLDLPGGKIIAMPGGELAVWGEAS